MIYINKDNKVSLSKLHENQKKFIKSDYLHTGLVGGYQSGKSQAAIIKVFVHLLQYPNVPIAYYLPKYGLFDDMLIPKIRTICDKIKLPFTHNQSKSKITTPIGEIWMRSMDNPDSIVSYSVGYSIVDEVDLVHSNKRNDVMKRIAGRNSFLKRNNKGEKIKNKIDYVSTPEGFAYMYDFFVKNKNENKLLLNLSTLDNEDNLADGYIQGLREQYTEEQLRAYLNGEFVNLSSLTSYYSFDRNENHSDRTAKKSDNLYVGIDFNIGNMNAVIHVIDDRPVAVDEISKAYDTNKLCQILKDKYPGNRIICYPDSSGKNRSTNSDTTDLEIIRKYGFGVRAKSTNPNVSDRVKNMNRMFCNSEGKRDYLVNTHKCPDYTEALEKCPNDKHGVPDKTSGFDHITEAAGYFIYYEYPMTHDFFVL